MALERLLLLLPAALLAPLPGGAAGGTGGIAATAPISPNPPAALPVAVPVIPSP